MTSNIYQVDAFAAQRFGGNPAAVMILSDYPDEETLQSLAAENNLAETAFIVGGAGEYSLRWFTPTVEVPLCGHATLASAWVVLQRLEPDRAAVTFHTRSGALHVRRHGQAYKLDLPAYEPRPIAIPAGLEEALGASLVEVAGYPGHLLALVDSADIVRSLAPDFARLAQIDCSGVVVTASGDDGYDFISRFFAPAIGIPEDPVTGGAHCALVPYWAARTGQTEFRAYQASRRGGEIGCRLVGARVELSGTAVLYMEGRVEL